MRKTKERPLLMEWLKLKRRKRKRRRSLRTELAR